jgi:hypothetical protein
MYHTSCRNEVGVTMNPQENCFQVSSNGLAEVVLRPLYSLVSAYSSCFSYAPHDHPKLEGWPGYPTDPLCKERIGKVIGLNKYKPFHSQEEAMDNLFSSVSEMVNAGYCLTYDGRLIEIPYGTRVGIPDDDVPLSAWECQTMEVASENLRDHVLLGMWFRVGARISQDLGIRVSDVDFVLGRVFVERKKEGISFYRYLDPLFLALVAEYIRDYGLTREDYLFCIRFRPNSNDKWYKKAGAINRRGAAEIICYYAEKVGIQYRYISEKGHLRWRVHPQTSKYTYCSMGYEGSQDMLAVALSVGNKTIYPMMKNYIKVSMKRRHEVAKYVNEKITGITTEEVKLKITK